MTDNRYKNHRRNSTSKAKKGRGNSKFPQRWDVKRSSSMSAEQKFAAGKEDTFEPMTAEQIRALALHIKTLMEHPGYRPMKIKELAVLLGLPRERREELEQVLDSLVALGEIGLSKRGKYGRPEATAKTGVYSATSRGFGFVTVEGEEEDYYIHEKNTCGAMHGDTVKMAVLDGHYRGRRSEGKILQVVERGTKEVVGTYHRNKTFGFVTPDNTHIDRDIFVPAEHSLGAVTGHKVVVRLTSYGDEQRSPEGEITEILGHKNDPGVDITAIVRAYGIPDEFPEEVREEAMVTADFVDAAAYPERMDLREWRTVTIDGEDAKDLDDAVTLERLPSGYLLGVHIADVSEYVTEDSPLDREARKRGTSTYLADRVIPMLPHRLSDGVCSLNQGEDRLALSCLMEFDEKGNIVDHHIAETLLRVDRRMSYTSVQAVLDGDPEALCEHMEYVDLFYRMKELADKLRARRRRRGSVDFDLPETKITLDDAGRPVDIRPYVRSAATDIIEDFMLAANETVAEEYYWRELPFVYRTHERPDRDKTHELISLLRSMGVRLRLQDGELHPGALQKMLASVADSPEEAFISRLALRSLKQAKYSTECIGHFGLAASYYCHFTSPIRRYPDLQIHRIIKKDLRGTLDEQRINHYHSILQEVCRSSSVTERRANEAERAVNKMKMAQFMKSHIGEILSGVISGVTKWGLYVELPSTVEGLVHIRHLTDDYYIYDERQHALTGERSGRTYRIGQRVTVRVESVDLLASTIDFSVTVPDGVRGKERTGGSHG